MGRVTLVLAFLAFLLRPVPGAAQTTLSGDENQVYDLVNATRAEHRLAPLTRLASLDAVARAQSRRMVEAQDLFHNPDLAGALTATGLPWIFTGENVGVGADVVVIHAAFVASLHHYENIVKPAFDHMGVGVLSNPAGGVYVTHVFAQLRAAAGPLAPATPTPAPTAPRAAPTPRPSPTPVVTPGPPPATAVAVEGGVIAPGPDFGETPQPPRSPSLPARLLEWIFGR
jgi:hypothetical protein